MSDGKRTPSRRARSWRRGVVAAVAVVVIGAAAAVSALPWWLSGASGRAWLLGRANRALAPGALGLDSVAFSWFGPTRMTGFRLIDHEGEAVVASPTAVWDRNLFQILFQRPKLGRLDLGPAVLDVERDTRGDIDLYDTLRPILGRDPRTELRITVAKGRLRVSGAGLPEPIVADEADLDLSLHARPQPMAWTLSLRQNPGLGAGPAEVRVSGSFDQWAARTGGVGALAVNASASRWPWSASGRGLEGRGRLGGEVAVKRGQGRWSLGGDLRLGDVEIAGPLLAGDRVRPGEVRARVNLAETVSGWRVPSVSLQSDLVRLEGRGSFDPRGDGGEPPEALLRGTLDLAALAGQIPHALRLRDGVRVARGTASLNVDLRPGEASPVWEVAARVADLDARDAGGRGFVQTEPADLTARVVRGTSGAFQVERFAAETSYLKAEARGDLANGDTKLQAKFDLAGLSRQLRDVVDLGGLELSGRGEVEGETRTEGSAFRGQVRASLTDLRVGRPEGWVFGRPKAVLGLEADGPLGASAFPGGLNGLRASWKSDEESATAVVNWPGSRAEVAVETPVLVSERKGKASGRAVARWHAEGVTLDELALSLDPEKATDEARPVRLRAKGRYDRSGDELRLTAWNEGNAPESAARLSLTPEGLVVKGLSDPARLRADGGLSGRLDALAGWAGKAPVGLAGVWEARGSLAARESSWELAGDLSLDQLAWGTEADRKGIPGPVRVALSGSRPRQGGRVELRELTLVSPQLTVETSGRVETVEGRTRVALSGRTVPDWDKLSARLSERVEPGAVVRGLPSPLSVRVDPGEGWRDTLQAEAGVRVARADVFGLAVGPTEVVLRVKDGEVSVAPINAVVNGGKVHLEPEVVLDDGTRRVLLGPESTVSDVEVNDRVSHRVLSFVAPVFEQATRVRGRVSARVGEAVFPLEGEDTVKVEGQVVFQDVEFLPGSFLDPFVEFLGRAERPLVRLDQPVQLTIADRRIYQQGLSIPVARLARIDLEGWVGFDRQINMVASVPVLPPLLADRPVLNDVFSGTSIRVPVRGTLSDPQVDREAFKLGMKDTAGSLLERGLTRGVPGLIDALTRPRDPNAPPPPPRMSREERRLRQQEKRAERRMRRGLEP